MYVDLPHNGKRYHYAVHRLLAISFCLIPKRLREKNLEFKDLVVNHKNGIKYCNASFNLEWCTSKENTEHTWKEGLCDSIRGENAHLSKITEEQAKQIIAYMMEGKNNAFIQEKMGVSIKTIQHIRSKECWKHLTHNLTFPKLGTSKSNTIPIETVHKVCQILEQKEFSDPVIAKMVGVKREFVKDIRTHRRHKKISELYNF